MAVKKGSKTVNTSSCDKAREKFLNDAISAIEKSHGKGAIMKYDGDYKASVDVISTGSLAIDMALGIGGVPRGRIVEVYGHESSGKTTLTLHIIAEAQKAGGIAAFIDAEHAFDPDYAQNLGVNLQELYISQPSSGEEALDICEKLVRSGALDLIVIDSVAALTPIAEIEGEMGSVTVGLQARLMSSALRRLTAIIGKTNTCVIFINQIREKVNTSGYSRGPSETTTGGRALKFYSSIRMEIKKTESKTKREKDETIAYGYGGKVKIVKNKLASPFKVAKFEVIFGKGFSQEAALLSMAIDEKVILKSGAWLGYINSDGEKENFAQGQENAIIYLEDNPEFYDQIYNEVMKKIGILDSDEKVDSKTTDEVEIDVDDIDLDI